MRSSFRARSRTVTNYCDGDFAFDIRWPRYDELRELASAHNALGDTLREQRLSLLNELLLDTMVQNTPVAMNSFVQREGWTGSFTTWWRARKRMCLTDKPLRWRPGVFQATWRQFAPKMAVRP